jgi:hypothetical protein
MERGFLFFLCHLRHFSRPKATVALWFQDDIYCSWSKCTFFLPLCHNSVNEINGG